MKKNLFLLFLTILSASLHSQVRLDSLMTERIVSPIKNGGVGFLKAVAAYDNSYTFVMPGDEESFFNTITKVERVDANMKTITSVDLNLKDNNGIRKYCNLIYIANKLWLLTSYNNTKENRIYLFANTLNKYTLQSNDDLHMIAFFDNTTKSGNAILQSEFAISKDSTKLMLVVHGKVIQKIKPIGGDIEFLNSKLEPVVSTVCVFNSELNKLWECPISSAIDGFVITENRLQIDNNGNCFISALKTRKANSGFVMNPVSIRETNMLTVTYDLKPIELEPTILYFSKTGLENKEFSFNIPSCNTKSLNFKIDGDHLFCYGVYSDSGFYSAKGFYTCTLNLKSGGLENINRNPFPEKLLVPQLGRAELEAFRKISNKNEWDPYDYVCSETSTRSNGDLIFVIEQQLGGKVHETTENSPTIYIKPIMDYKNLFVITLAPDGKLKKMNVIGRTMRSTRDSNLPFQYFLKKDALFLVFMNSNRVNNDTYTTADINLSLAKLSMDGNISIKVIENYLPFKKYASIAGIKFNAKDLLPRMDAILSVPEQNAFVYLSQNKVKKKSAYQKVVAQ